MIQPSRNPKVAVQQGRNRTRVGMKFISVALGFLGGILVVNDGLWSAACAPGAVQAQARAQVHVPVQAKTLAHVTMPSTGKLVSLGDSITFGYNLGNNRAPSPKAFPTLVARVWSHQSHRLWLAVNLGVPGWTSTNLLHALGTPRFQRALRTANCVTLDIGSNDLLQATPALLRVAGHAAISGSVSGSKQNTTTIPPQTKQALVRAVARYARNLPAILAAIRKQTAAPVVLVTLYDPIPDNNPVHPAAESAIAAINQIIYDTAAANQLVTADAYSAIAHRQYSLIRVAQLDIHPTALGQQALASAVVSATSNPLWYTPMAYAVPKNAMKGAVIRVSPSVASNALWWLHGWQGVLVTAEKPGWYGVTAPDGRSGYLSAKSAALLVRPWSNLSFLTQRITLEPVRCTFPAMRDTAGFVVHGTDYLSIRALRALVQGSVTWNPAMREISITLPTTEPFTLAGRQGGTLLPTGNTSRGQGRGISTVSSAGIELTINGEPIRLTHEPLLINGVVYVPAAEVWQALGGHVTSHATHGASGQPTLSLRGSSPQRRIPQGARRG